MFGTSDVAILKHDNGLALQTADGSLTYGVLTPVGATFRKLIVQEEIVVADNALALSKVNGLIDSLATKQGTIGNILYILL